MRFFIVIAFFVSLLYASPKKVLIISTPMGATSQSSKMQYLKNAAQQIDDLSVDYTFSNALGWSDINGSVHFTTTSVNDEIMQKKLFFAYDLILFDSLAGAMSLKSTLNSFADTIEESEQKIIVPLPMVEEEAYRKNISEKDHKALYAYWSNGGAKNLDNMIDYIHNRIFLENSKNIEPAVEIPKEGIYHPQYENIVFKTTKAYFEYFGIKKGEKPIIALAFHRGSFSSNTMAPIDDAIKHLEAKGVAVLPYFTKVGGDDFVGMQFLQENNETIVDVVINFQIMIIDHESLKPIYQQLNVPILHALYYRHGDEKKWKEDTSGVHFSMIPMTYIIPETLGYTEGLVVATQNQKTKEIETIPYQLNALVQKAFNMAKLKHLENRQKKVALMFYNYPPGINNLGASFLNIPESLTTFFKHLSEEGYSTESKDQVWFEAMATKILKAYYESGKEEEMLTEGVAALFAYEDYIDFFETLPQEIQDAMNRKWGKPDQSKMVIEKKGDKFFLIPRVRLGNVILMPQPRRADRKDNNISQDESDSNLWHNTNIAVNHAYLAAYLYVRKQFEADALIHFGTHGTQEWMPGKERGLSIYDNPFLVLGDLPIFYPYITNNVAESIQAKRRGRATLISHQTPPFGLTGTYNELGEIMENITQYKSVDEGMLKANLKKMITQTAIAINVHRDLEYTEAMIADDFEMFISKLEDFILATSATAQPLGMHTYGTYPKDEHLITTVMQMVGKEFMQKADGERYFSKDYTEFNQSKAYSVLRSALFENNSSVVIDPELAVYVDKAKAYANSFKNQKEIKNLVRALNGEYIESGIGGDPIRNPSSVPTGNNMYGFDPSKVPTPAAYKTGSKLMKDFIENFYQENGKYPTKLTFNLWSLETMRHYGVLESEILYAMGVKPIWNEQGLQDSYIQSMALPMLKNYLPDFLAKWIASMVTLPRIEMVLSWLPEKMAEKPQKMIKHAKAVNKGDIIDVEIIPYSELKRPCADVVVSATGLYRDTFPQTMQLIAKAVDKVASLKEDKNHLYINANKIKQNLLDKNISIEEATRLSTIRVFSNKSGKYGSGVSKLTNTEKFTAETDSAIAEDYLEERGYYFGADEKSWNQKLPHVDLYAQNLSGTDSVLFSRTSNLYALLTSDDPYGYFGALSLAIRDIDGKAPKTYISNLRDPNGAKMQSTAEFMAQELRSRYFHPKWIEEMKSEGYSGTQGVLDVVNNFWGWQVVDPNVVRDDQWKEFFEVYIQDKHNLGLKEWFEKANADNLAQMMERMLEAVRLGYWQADEKTVKTLKERYKKLEITHNVKSYNEKFKALLESDQVSGFGLAKPISAKLEMANSAPKQNKKISKESGRWL
ncbi:MAG: cobaltochelatase subunit CobN [Epsilonproteobacteria bacterium]|nr:cobaltochelatase subunit CobN [Campylobacterota bacterium]